MSRGVGKARSPGVAEGEERLCSPGRKLGQFELLQLLQERLEADENKLGSPVLQNKRWKKLVSGNCQT